MATDFTNITGFGYPVHIGSKINPNQPTDVRCRIETIDEMNLIEYPFIGMLVYVLDEDKFYIVKSIRDVYKIPGVEASKLPGFRVDTYEEFKVGCNCSLNFDSVQKLLDILYDINNGIDAKNKIDELANMLQNQGGGNTGGGDSGDNDDEPEVDEGDGPWNPNAYNETQIALKMTQESPGYLIGNYSSRDRVFSIEGANYEVEDITIERNGQNEYYKIITLDNFPTKVSFKYGTYIEKVINMCNTSRINDMQSMFYYCKSLTSINTNNFNTENVTSMYYMFYNCAALTTLDVSNWDTSNVTNMQGVFNSCTALTQLDVSNWNTSNVTDMSYMFCGFTASTLDVSNFNTEKVTDMQLMFQDCKALTSLDVSNWNTSNVTNMRQMFYGCEALTSLYLSNLKTDKCISLSYMFYRCKALTTIGDVSSWNVSEVDNMYDMFEDCESLISLNLSNWNCSKNFSLYRMFYNCKSLVSLNMTNFNTSNVDNMVEVFYGCSSLTHLDLSSWNTSRVTSMYNTFSGCSSLTTLDIRNWSIISTINGGGNIYSMFKGCVSLYYSNINMSNCSSTTIQKIKNAYDNDL